MKRFLSVLLAVVMIAAMLPAGTVFAADGDNTDIVFDFVQASKDTKAAWLQVEANAGKTWPTGAGFAFSTDAMLDDYMPAGIMPNYTIGADASMYVWQGNAAIRVCNQRSTWETWTDKKLNTTTNTIVDSKTEKAATNKNITALDITISENQAGWYRPSISFPSYGRGVLYSAYILSGEKVQYVGEISAEANAKKLNPVYLDAGVHTLILGCHHGEMTLNKDHGVDVVLNGSPATFISKITLYAVNKTPVVVADSVVAPATLAVGEAGTVDASALTVSDEAGTYDVAIYAADAATGKSLGESTVDYVEVTSSSPYVAEVKKTSSTTYSITPKHEGDVTLTITPVVGGVAQTAMATTKTLSVTNEDFRFDFVQWVTEVKPTIFPSDRFLEFSAEQSPKYFAANRTKTAQTSGVFLEANHLRVCNISTTWTNTALSGGNGSNNKWAFDVTVPEGKAGWYEPSFTLASATPAAKMSVYHVFGDKATFLGDWDGALGKTAPSLNAVYLNEGVNTFVIAVVDGTAQPTIYYDKFEFKKLAAAPTMAAPAVADLPAEIAVNEEVSATATVSMSDGSLYQFPEYAINVPTNFQSAGKDTKNYIKVTSSVDGVVEITDAKPVGALKKDKASFTVKGLKYGTTTLTFTPVIDGVEKADLATTKTIKVKSWDIKYDFEPIHVTYVRDNEDLREVNRPLNDISKLFSVKPELKDLMPEGIALSSLNVADSLMRWNTSALRFCSHGSDWSSNGSNSRLAFDITLDADQAGWYRPNFQSASGYSAQFYVYVKRADGTIKYLGELTANGKRLNAVYLGEGVHTLVLGCYAKNGADATTYIKEINLYRYENEPTLKTFTASIPSAIALGGAAGEVKFESATLSDTGSFAYGTYKMLADGQARFDKDGTEDYMLVESSNPSVAKVERVGADKWTITPVSDGTTTITVTPYYNGVAYDALKQTKTVQVTYPNESVNYAPNFIVNAVVGDEGTNAEAAALITTNGLAVGEIGAAQLGSTVTLTAEDSDTYKFLYWYNGNSKKILSDAKTYNFTVGTKAAIYAKYARVGDELTEYATAAGQLTTEDKITIDEEKTTTVGNFYKLYVDAAEGYVSELVKKTAEAAEFVCWTKDGKVVSYNAEYNFYTWPGAETAVEETEGEKSDVPAVVLFENDGAYMLELVNFEGKTIVEKGILFASSGVPTVNNFGAKAVSADLNATQFMASSDDATEARAYVIYKDGANYRVAYSD